MTAATEELVAPPPTEPGRLHKPWRALVALGELLIAGVAVWFAVDLWPRGVATIVERVPNGPVLESTRYIGSWITAAIGLGTVAALLAVDACRQTILAVRARPKRRK
ncbi:MAG: hypothetical protein LC635_05005 [Pseudonocardiaceae bacterium]|nr:hypothetical protein [Pseudonocardiaceae bacterium]